MCSARRAKVCVKAPPVSLLHVRTAHASHVRLTKHILCFGSATGANGTQQIYFRGARNLDALLDDLLDNQGLDSAERVLLSGESRRVPGQPIGSHHTHTCTTTPINEPVN